MEAKLQDQIAFYLTGRRAGSEMQKMDPACRPALFSRFNDLSSLRYDLPLIMNHEAEPEKAVLSLTRLVDEAVEALDENIDRDRVARHGYRLERELRRDLAANGTGDLASMWKVAAERLESEGDESVRDSANRLWKSFKASGDIVDTDRELPSRVVEHVWNTVNERKARAFRQRSERLLLKLRDILEAEFVGSAVGRAPDRLMAGVGTSFATTFDFTAMSRILVEAKPSFELSEGRRQRISMLIDVLECQRFYPLGADGPEPFAFTFDKCSDASEAYQDRHPDAVEVLKALAIAELEVNGDYREPVHDVLFNEFGANGLDQGDLAALPDYLVCANAGTLDAVETAQLVDLLAAGMPIKILFRTDDVLEPAKLADGHFAFGSRARQLVDTAIGLTDVFVVQTSASRVCRMLDHLVRGLSFGGPALFSVFSGVNGNTGDLPAYLVAAAAVESRVFPTMVYDPSSGSDYLSRLNIDDNPDHAKDWPVHVLKHENKDLQAGSEEIAFTLADFIAMDARFAGHFAILPESDRNESLIPVQEGLQIETKAIPEKVPYISLIDANGRLKRAIVDRRTILETRRCLTMWQNLQELSGALRPIFPVQGTELVAEAESAGTQAREISPEAKVTSANVSEPQLQLPVEAETESHGDEPYIESARCTTCNECTNLNNQMFAYNAEKQAYIADADAGTFRQLVEAAEGCQVSIIHPGKPRNPKEPGLEDLIKRAAEFN